MVVVVTIEEGVWDLIGSLSNSKDIAGRNHNCCCDSLLA
jgi:hypothetical protein